MADDLVTFSGVWFGYGRTPVLRDVDIRVPARGITALAGPSGSGKSTLLRLANRLLVPDLGTVSYRGVDVATMQPPMLRRRLGMVFQRPSPFPGTVRDNLAAGDPELTDDAGLTLLKQVGLEPDFLVRDATELSGGQLQRMCLARALATRPEGLLLDEPTAALDPTARHGLEQLARELAGGGMPLVWVTHDIDQLRRVADTVVLLSDGGVRLVGDLASLEAASVDDPAVARFLAGDTGSPATGEEPPDEADGRWHGEG
jgi:putative ABC transport system ATP-binding protein